MPGLSALSIHAALICKTGRRDRRGTAPGRSVPLDLDREDAIGGGESMSRSTRGARNR
jgi:hypothetical protein